MIRFTIAALILFAGCGKISERGYISHERQQAASIVALQMAIEELDLEIKNIPDRKLACDIVRCCRREKDRRGDFGVSSDAMYRPEIGGHGDWCVIGKGIHPIFNWGRCETRSDFKTCSNPETYWKKQKPVRCEPPHCISFGPMTLHPGESRRLPMHVNLETGEMVDERVIRETSPFIAGSRPDDGGIIY